MQHWAPAFFVYVRTAADKSPAVFSMMEKENPFGLPKTGPIMCPRDEEKRVWSFARVLSTLARSCRAALLEECFDVSLEVFDMPPGLALGMSCCERHDSSHCRLKSHFERRRPERSLQGRCGGGDIACCSAPLPN